MPRPTRKSVPWHRDPEILDRMGKVERLHLRRLPNVAIAQELGVDEKTVRRDLERLAEVWKQRLQNDQEALKAEVVAEQNELIRRGYEAYDWDLSCESAVLFGSEDADARKVIRDDKGSVQFRGNKAAALAVVRAAIMDKAKILGLVIDKKSLTDDEGKGLDLASILAEAREIVRDGPGPADPKPHA